MGCLSFRNLKSALQKFFRELWIGEPLPVENTIEWQSFPDLRAEIADLKEVIRIITTMEVVEVSPYSTLPVRLRPLEGSSGLRLAQRMSDYAIRLERELADYKKLGLPTKKTSRKPGTQKEGGA